MNKIKLVFKNNLLYCFLLPFILLSLILIIAYLVGGFTYIAYDCYEQYFPFYNLYYEILKNGGSIFHSWKGSLGVNVYSVFAYYLSSPLNLIILLFPKNYIVTIMNILIILKISLCGFSFGYYVKKKFRTEDHLILFSCIYALSGYMIGYIWNLMWFDSIFLFPFILLGLEKLVYEKQFKLYIVALFLSIIFNYMIGYMICLFLFIYFFTLNFENFRDFFIKGIRFALSSILAVAMAAIILYPTVVSIGSTAVSNSSQLEYELLGDVSDSIANFLFLCQHVSVTSTDNKVNTYISIFGLLFAISYFLNKEIKWVNKIKNLILIILLFVSFNVGIINFIWHGFHVQSSIPNRMAFMLVFLLLTMGFESLYKKDGLNTTRIVLSNIPLIALSGYFYFWGSFHINIAIFSILLSVIYTLFFIMVKRPFVTLVAIELIIMTISGFIVTSGVKTTNCYDYLETMAEIRAELKVQLEDREAEYYTDKSVTRRLYNYVKNNEINLENLEDALDKISELGYNDQSNADTFYNLNGISMFNTFLNKGFGTFMSKTGNTGSANSVKYIGENPVMNMLLGVKYLYYKEGSTTYDFSYQYLLSEENVTVYQNKYVLSTGYLIDSDVDYDSISHYENPFTNLNLLINLMAGFDDVYTKNTFQLYEVEHCSISSGNDTHYSFVKDSDNQVLTYKYSETEDDSNLYYYINSSDINYMEVYVNNELISTQTKVQRMISVPNLTANDNVVLKVYIKDSVKSGKLNIYSAKINKDVFENVYDDLASSQLEITTYTDTVVEGTIDVTDEDKYLLLTIPVDDNWDIYVDGELTSCNKFYNLLIELPLDTGTHTIRLEYHQKGFTRGVIISIISILIFLCLCFIKRINWQSIRKRKY